MDWSNIALSLWFHCNVYAEYLLIVVMFKIVEKCWTFADWQWEPHRGDARIIGAVGGSKLWIVLSACGWNTLYLVKCGTTITTYCTYTPVVHWVCRNIVIGGVVWTKQATWTLAWPTYTLKQKMQKDGNRWCACDRTSIILSLPARGYASIA